MPCRRDDLDLPHPASGARLVFRAFLYLPPLDRRKRPPQEACRAGVDPRAPSSSLFLFESRVSRIRLRPSVAFPPACSAFFYLTRET